MATQMAALDEFVTRARSQNDSHHVDRVQSLGRLVSNAQDGFAHLQAESDASKISLEDFGSEYNGQIAGLNNLFVSFDEETRLPLQGLRTEFSDTNLMEYTPTGQTPQKRDWDYPTELPRTENHESIIAKLRGLPDPALTAKTPSSARTPARSPRKQASPRKGPASPSKLPSPSKTKIFTDVAIPMTEPETVSQFHSQTTTTMIPLEQSAKSGLKEIDINVMNRPASSSTSSASSADERPVLLDFSKSMGAGGGGPPPLKRHATTNAVVESRLPMKLGRAKSTVTGMGTGVGVENFSQSVGPLSGGRRLRSSPPE